MRQPYGSWTASRALLARLFLAFVGLGPASGISVDRVQVGALQNVIGAGFLTNIFQQAKRLAIVARRFRALAREAKLCSHSSGAGSRKILAELDLDWIIAARMAEDIAAPTKQARTETQRLSSRLKRPPL
jgi:hypothetical protein